MPNPRKPFRINVGFIMHEDVGYQHKIPFEMEKVKLEDLELHNLDGMVTIDRTPQGLFVQGSVFCRYKTRMCAMPEGIRRSSCMGIYRAVCIHQKSVSESELLVPDDAHIDLAPLIREYALLEVPIKALHDPDCKGLCIECGQDLNVKDCGHSQENDDSPLKRRLDMKNFFKI
jgi:uncharacterized protein